MEVNNKKFIKPINIEGTKKIWEQLSTCICKVKNNYQLDFFVKYHIITPQKFQF